MLGVNNDRNISTSASDQVKNGTAGRVAVLVLGDLARSPRMLYHTAQLAQAGFAVDLLGYCSERAREALVRPLQQQTCGRVNVHPVPSFARLGNALQAGFLPYQIWAPLRVILQAVVLAYMLLFRLPRPDVLLIQNPPSLPTLPLARAVRFFRGSRLIIDWHNLGHSLLRLRSGASKTMVILARRAETTWGRFADCHFCVSAAMQDHLLQELNVVGPTCVLYDKPQDSFCKLLESEANELLQLHLQYLFPRLSSFCRGRDLLVVSSTSWTPDEDFNILLNALVLLNEKLSAQTSEESRVVVVVTGKGPLRASFEAQVRALAFTKIDVMTGWLRIEDYPRLLGSADLGLCVHASSSGIDLPMKIVDMFGCGLPVCALEYPCIKELVRPEFGCLFSSPEQLADQIYTLFNDRVLLQDYSDSITAHFKKHRWSYEWQEKARPHFITLKN